MGVNTPSHPLSAAAHAVSGVQVAYSMAKAAGHALMRHVAARHGAQGIRANSIAPAMTLHPRLEAELPEAFVDMAKSAAAIKSRVGTPEDIAAMVCFLAGPGGRMIPGQTLGIDGHTESLANWLDPQR